MTTFKEVFEAKTTPNLEIKRSKKFNFLPFLAICSFVFLAVIINPSAVFIDTPSTSEIYVNPMNRIGIIDLNIKLENASDLQYPFINELKKDYQLLDTKSVYNIDNPLNNKCGYGEFNSYRLYFDNFTVSFSETNQPASDYSMSKERPRYSQINEVDVAIYEYENTYYAIFEYNHIFFEIESTMTIEELVGVLNTIIK